MMTFEISVSLPTEADIMLSKRASSTDLWSMAVD